MQFDPIRHRVKGTEDCLALNVYTQTVSNRLTQTLFLNQKKKSKQLSPDEGLLPVMVWIHGGGFSMGSGNGENYLYGPKYFMNKDIVLVTVNYRLNSFGTHVITARNSPVDGAMRSRLLFDRI